MKEVELLRRQMITGLVIAVIAALLLTACGVTRGEEESGLHRLRMMVPNAPGGGYDLTARTAVKIMEDDDITGRVEVFNVIGAGGTVAMARLMNEKGNDDLMMMMGLGVVGATYTNGSKARASDATALAKMVEEQEGILVPADSPFKTVNDFVAAWKADPAAVTIGGGSSPGGPDHLFPMETAKRGSADRAVGQEDHRGHNGSRRIPRPDRVGPTPPTRGIRQRADRGRRRADADRGRDQPGLHQLARNPRAARHFR